MVRHAIVSGQFYSDNFSQLEEQIKQSFSVGPGALPITKRKNRITGIISPHAGYIYSGPGAAWGFKEIGEAEFPDVYIIIGLSHSGFKSCISLEKWETPFGQVDVDIALGERVIKNSRMSQDEFAHSHEHSIEVQLPFLQFVSKNYLSQLRILPIIAGPNLKPGEIAEGIIKSVNELKRNACFITSSDFTHYGLNYGYLPFTQDVKKNLYELDKKAIDFILKLDSSGFLDYTEKTGATICGKYPIAVMVEVCNLLNVKIARLLHYYTSGDITEDYDNAVGYASIVFR